MKAFVTIGLLFVVGCQSVSSGPTYEQALHTYQMEQAEFEQFKKETREFERTDAELKREGMISQEEFNHHTATTSVLFQQHAQRVKDAESAMRNATR